MQLCHNFIPKKRVLISYNVILEFKFAHQCHLTKAINTTIRLLQQLRVHYSAIQEVDNYNLGCYQDTYTAQPSDVAHLKGARHESVQGACRQGYIQS